MSLAALRLLRDEDLVEMSPTGGWQPTRKGEVWLQALDLLRELCGGPQEKAPSRGMMNERARAGRRRGEVT